MAMIPADFKTQIRKKTVSPLTVFVGEEAYGMEELVHLLRDTYLDHANRDFNFEQFACREAEMETVLNAARTSPFLASRRLVVLRNLQELSDGARDSLGEYLQNPVSETLLVMTAERLDKKLSLSRLLRQHADWVEFSKLRDYQVADVMRKKAAEAGRHFSREALDLFCHRCGTDMHRLNSEMAKLFQYLGERKNIDVEDIVNAGAEGGEASIFELLNSLGRRKLADILICLQEQLAENAAPHFILIMVARHFRQLWKIQSLSQQGLDKTAIAGKAGVNRFFYDAMQAQAQNWSAVEMRQVFERLLETDRLLKTSDCSSAPVLENLVWRIVNS